MSLNIYTNLQFTDKRLIKDVDTFFGETSLRQDEFTLKVLKEIEKAEYVTADTFKDRFGRYLYTTNLSTGTKILLSLHYYTDKLINGALLGDNCIDFIPLLKEGNLYIGHRFIEFSTHITDIDITYNNVAVASLLELNERIGGYYED